MNGQNVLVIGSGGREHALALALSKSQLVDKVYCAPGNGGTARTEKCENVPIPATALTEQLDFALDKDIDLTVVGPEDPLAGGIVNLFESESLRVVGATCRGAKLESSKAFAKDFMREHTIPTADYRVFTDPRAAHAYIDQTGPVYVKASGLALGKGAYPGLTREQAHDAVEKIMVRKEVKDAGNVVVIEENLEGEEASIMALVNSDSGCIIPLLPSQDHKKLLDGDEGPNTGGMGAYAPTLLVTKELDEQIYEKILRRTADGLKEQGRRFKGVLYPGLKITNDGPKVLEFNVRFGDPETQPVLTLLESDMYELFNAFLNDKAADGLRWGPGYPVAGWKPGYAVTVVAASGGYPGEYVKGKEIVGLNKDGQLDVEGVTIHHAGTKYEDGKFYTNGGRVLGVTAVGETMWHARSLAYDALSRISFDGMVFRKDIGARELARVR